jgi:hypothetical protein
VVLSNLFMMFILALYLFCYKVIGPFNVLKIHFGTKINFFYFSILFSQENRKELPDSRKDRKSSLLVTIPTTK